MSAHPKGRPFPTRAGTWVRSEPERRIADWLHARDIAFEYEPLVEGKRPDFILPGRRTIVEYWGGAGFSDYQERMVEKTAIFEAAGWRVVHVVPANLWELDRVLTDALLADRAAHD